MNIDFVIAWVNGNDPEWQQSYLRHRGKAHKTDACRFRDWGLLRYWFRAIEAYAPWVNRVFFITNGQVPEWMNTDCEKLRIVNHREYIPEDLLPTFNSNTINLNLHRIPDLSEHFVYFDDDVFLNAPVEPEHYFIEGLPCDYNAERLKAPIYDNVAGYGIYLTDYCNIAVLNSLFNRHEVIRERPDLWRGDHLTKEDKLVSEIIGSDRCFHGFTFVHNEKPFLKSAFAEAWEKAGDRLYASCTQFRIDYEPNIYFMRYWQMATNRFHPIPNRKDAGLVSLDAKSLMLAVMAMNKPNIKSLCLNDYEGCSQTDFYKIAPELQKQWEIKLPKKSVFEKSLP